MLDQSMIQSISAALAEDAPNGDVTTENLIPADARAVAKLRAREVGVFSGSEVIRETFLQLDSNINVQFECEDGQQFAAGQTLAVISGNARAILRGERIALNFSQRMCGIAWLTSQYVQQIQGTQARILDTRKTTPGLRSFERQAVRDGGGSNHRFSLSDAVLIKDNHLSVLADEHRDLAEALRQLRDQVGPNMTIEVEVDRLDQIPAVLSGNADIILLDNFSLADLRQGVQMINGDALVEASGGITLNTVRDVAETGVDRISVGALTHSVRALDLGLDIEIQAI